MRPSVPSVLLERASEWDELHRWERSELGKELRRLGLTYGEIRELIPVPKGTLSYWCRGIRLSEDQVEAIRERTGPDTRIGIPVDTQWRRREEIDRIRAEARGFAVEHLDDPFFVAGVVLYWGEGAKTGGDLSLANADPRALRLFIAWVRRYLDQNAEFVLKVNLHADNDEPAARRYWAAESGLRNPRFYKTFIKPDGTGHRKNHLKHGVCMVRVRRCADAWNATMAFMDVIADGRMFPRASR
jgi:hypothetical protein